MPGAPDNGKIIDLVGADVYYVCIKRIKFEIKH